MAVERPRRLGRGAGDVVIVGLTGSIGMGKSAVSKFFQEFGVPVDDADAVVHKLYSQGGAAVQPIRDLFGDAVISEDGGISRPALSKFVVGEANAANLKKVEEVVFPLVDIERQKFVAENRLRGEPVIVFDIPLLFERGAEKLCDTVVVVSTTAEKQRERVLARPGMVEAKFEAILAKQVPDAEKRKKADRVIDTGVTLEETRAEVASFVEECRSQVRAEQRRPWVIGGVVVVLLVGVVFAFRASRR